MDFKALILTTSLILALPAAYAGSSTDGESYTNFGLDLMTPIFPIDGKLTLYQAKGDATPFAEFKDLKYVMLYSGPLADKCLAKPEDGWVRCKVQGKTGWVRRNEFRSGAEYKPVEHWPIRYWLYIASDGTPGEETSTLIKAARRSPYLVTEKEYANVFFKVLFDKQGYAISPKTGKRTGDRVFEVANAIYLAPSDDAKRERANWLFLNYYEPSLQALCPSLTTDSCYSAANQSVGWKGIKLLHTSPAPQYAFDREKQAAGKTRWEGFEEVAFARFDDPVIPLMYYVPQNVLMSNENANTPEAKRLRNRDKPFCIMDCN